MHNTPTLKTIEEISLTGKRIFMRLDLNVPVEINFSGVAEIKEDHRILQSLKTIQYAIEQGGRIILASHLGRPQDHEPHLSLEPIAKRLASLLNQEITLTDHCSGDHVTLMAQGLKNSQVLLLENLRFHPGEEQNQPEFSRSLAKLAQVYITDAFGTAHRRHASTYGVPALLEERGIGFLITQELHFLNLLLDAPQKPFMVLLGGSKVSDKLKVIQTLFKKMDCLLIGGAMGHAFWMAQNRPLPQGCKPPSPEEIQAAQTILKEARQREIPILLPEDLQSRGLDIGPRTIRLFQNHLTSAQTIFWNGPMGYYENPEFALGTNTLATTLAQHTGIRMIGGGDTVSAIKQAGLADQFSYLSTGGGAALTYLENRTLPGLEVLKYHARSLESHDDF